MRLLFLPVYTNKNLNGCTSYNTGKKLVRQALENDDVFIHWYLPSMRPTDPWYYHSEPDPIENAPRLLVHRARMEVEQYTEVGFVPQDIFKKFSQQWGQYHIDAVLTERPASVWYLRKLLKHSFSKDSADGKKHTGKTPEIVTFVRDPFVKSTELHGINRDEELAQTMGYLLSYNIFFSEYDFDLATKVAKKYLNFAQVKRLRDRSIVISAGTDTEELDTYKQNAVPRDKLTILIAERLKSGTLMNILEASDYIFKRGADIGVVVSSQAAFNPATLKNYPTLFEHAEKYSANPREKYLELAAQCHVTMTMPSTHSYPQGLMERLYLGNVGILPDYPWVDSVLPNYPFKVPSRNVPQIIAMTQWVLDNYEEAQKRVAWVPKYIKENYDSRVCTQRMLDFMKEKVEYEKSKTSPLGGYLDVVDSIPYEEIEESALLDYMHKNTDNKVKFNVPGVNLAFQNNKAALFLAMESAGWQDTCEGPFAKFIRHRGD